ncbi:hypothetical protein BB560_004741, partial [Smittium megazygosporum]
MPIDSLFIITDTGTSILEKNFRNELISKRACFSALTSFTNQFCNDPQFDRTLPFWVGPAGTFGVFVVREHLVFLCILSEEETITMYTSKLSIQSVKDNFVTIYQLVSEMVDDGIIVVTDPSELQNTIPIPNLFHKIVGAVAGIDFTKSTAARSVDNATSSHLSTTKPFQEYNFQTSPGFNSNLNYLPWRDNSSSNFGEDGIKYSKNEVYLDFVESLNFTVDSTSKIVEYEVLGKIYCNSKLSGIPELKLMLSNLNSLDDIGFHRCVKLAVFESSKLISFVPPDGYFKLATYSIKKEALPLDYLVPVSLDIRKFNSDTPSDPSSANILSGLEINLSPFLKHYSKIQDIAVSIPLPSGSSNIDIKCTFGSYVIDALSSVVQWSIGDIDNSHKSSSHSYKLKLKYYR